MAEDIIIPVVVFATIFGIFYVWIITRNKERMALIEKGADASIFFSKKRSDGSRKNTVLGVGMFFLGIALGILIGALLAYYTTLPEGVTYSSMIIFFGGLSLVIFHVTDKKSMAKED
jgi:predicted MFS family arabinose efflux permease